MKRMKQTTMIDVYFPFAGVCIQYMGEGTA